MLDPGRRPTLVLVAAFAALGAAWAAFARWVVPPIIASAYAGKSLPRLNRFFEHRAAPHPLEHYLTLWYWFAAAVLLAGCCQLAIVLIVQRRGTLRQGLSYLVFAALFLAVTVLSGPRHDYTAFLEIWDQVLLDGDPWGIRARAGNPLNAYGPLFNVLALLDWFNPLAPKLLFAFAYILFAIDVLERNGRSRLAWLALAANPYPWVEIAYFGHFDILVALACVAAVDASRRGCQTATGAFLALGILLKYLPALLVPFFVFDRRRFHPRMFLSVTIVTTLGMLPSWLIWGASTFRPLSLLTVSRTSELLSVFRFLRGAYSPLQLFQRHPDLDTIASPCLLVALLIVFAWCQIRRIELAHATVLALLTTVLLYRIGYPQYWMSLYVLAAWWALGDPKVLEGRGFLIVALILYFGWLGLFNLFYATIDGIVRPGGPWSWVGDVAGLPTFLLGGLLLVSLLRSRPSSG